MTVDVPVGVHPARAGRRPAALPALTGHAIRAVLRDPAAAFFTLAFPLAFLVIVAAIVGDQRTESGVPVTQYLVSPFAVFGVASASFTVLAANTAALRESGVLLRQRAAPVPAWTVLGARIGASVVVSGAAVVLLTAVGTAAYGVRPVWPKVPAMVVTLLLGICCCAALGLALAAAVRTAGAARALAQGLLIPLAFISDVFIVGAALPRWLDVTGSLLPLKHFARAMSATFDPGPGLGFSPGHLAVLAAWTVAGVLLAGWRFGWEPRGSARTRPPAERVVAGRARLSAPLGSPARPAVALIGGQIRHALLGLSREPLTVFFTVAFPALLLVLFPVVFGDARTHGLSMAQYLFAGMLAYTAAVAGYVDLPEQVAGARAAGVLKRLAATPLPQRCYLGARVAAAGLIAALAAAVLAAAGIGFLGVRMPWAHVPALLVALAVGALCFACTGLAVTALLPAARSLVAVTLGTLLPLCFASEIFVVGDRPLPAPLTTVAALFPPRHLLQALLSATRPDGGGSGFAWVHLAVLAGWAGLALLIVRARRAL